MLDYILLSFSCISRYLCPSTIYQNSSNSITKLITIAVYLRFSNPKKGSNVRMQFYKRAACNALHVLALSDMDVCMTEMQLFTNSLA